MFTKVIRSQIRFDAHWPLRKGLTSNNQPKDKKNKKKKGKEKKCLFQRLIRAKHSMIIRDLYLAKRMFYFSLRMRVRKWKIITSGCFSVFRMWRQSFLEIRILLSMSLVLYWSQPINNQCCVWISACGSYYDCKMPFSYNHQGALKKKNKGLFLTRPGNYTAHLGPHSVVMGRGRVPGPWFCFYWRQRWGPRVSQAHSFCEFKT